MDDDLFDLVWLLYLPRLNPEVRIYDNTAAEKRMHSFIDVNSDNETRFFDNFRMRKQVFMQLVDYFSDLGLSK